MSEAVTSLCEAVVRKRRRRRSVCGSGLLPTYASATARRDAQIDRRRVTSSSLSPATVGMGLRAAGSAFIAGALCSTRASRICQHSLKGPDKLSAGVVGSVQTRHRAPRQLGQLKEYTGFLVTRNPILPATLPRAAGVIWSFSLYPKIKFYPLG